MREHSKALEAIQEAIEHDAENQHSSEIQQLEIKIQSALYAQRGEETQEQTFERAMRDPEISVGVYNHRCSYCDSHSIQSIMSDPVMQQILQQAQSDPKSLQDHMRNAAVRQKIQKLINAGIIRTR